MLFRGEFVADTVNGFDKLAGFTEFLPEMPDMHVNRAVNYGGLIAPGAVY